MKENKTSTASKPSMASKLKGYFIAGVLVTAPITITIWLTIAIINFIDKRVKNLILPDGYYDGVFTFLSIPGVGIIIAIAFLLIVGMFATNILGRFFVRVGESILDHLPVVRSLYGATKQIFETVFANQSEAFREVVLIEYPKKDSWVIGFLTGRTKGEVQERTDNDVVNIFVPTTPNPTSGFLLFIPEKDVIKLDMTIEEGIKLVVSAGIVTPEHLQQFEKET